MPIQTTPVLGNSVDDALTLAALLRPGWDEVSAAIPAWHPRLEETTEERAAREAADAAQADWESDDNPYKKRHADTQSAYTQGQQRLRELEALEKDPSAYLELGKKQGWIEVEEPDLGAGGIDPELAATKQQLGEVLAWKQQVESQMQAERQAAGMQLFHDDLDAWATEAGTKLSKADHAAIYGTLMQSPDPTEEAHAKAAFEAHIAHKQAEREQWKQEFEEQRRRPRVATVPVTGTEATGTPNWSEMTPEAIDEYMAERVAGGR